MAPSALGGAFGVLSKQHAGHVEKIKENRMTYMLTFTRYNTSTIWAKAVLATKNLFFFVEVRLPWLFTLTDLVPLISVAPCIIGVKHFEAHTGA